MADPINIVTVIYFSDCWWCSDIHCPPLQGSPGRVGEQQTLKIFFCIIFHLPSAALQDGEV